MRLILLLLLSLWSGLAVAADATIEVAVVQQVVGGPGRGRHQKAESTSKCGDDLFSSHVKASWVFNQLPEDSRRQIGADPERVAHTAQGAHGTFECGTELTENLCDSRSASSRLEPYQDRVRRNEGIQAFSEDGGDEVPTFDVSGCSIGQQ